MINELEHLYANAADAKTMNGAPAFSSTGDKCLDLFNLVGASRGTDLSKLIASAMGEDFNLAGRVVLFGRDIRGGAGERDPLEAFLHLFAAGLDLLRASRGETDPAQGSFKSEVVQLCKAVVEVGRYKDLEPLLEYESTAFMTAFFWYTSIYDGKGLAAKWAPRKGKYAAILRKFWTLSPKQYRHFIVNRSNTVEQDLCAQNYASIEFNSVPSVAMKHYAKAFARHCGDSFIEWKADLVEGKNGAKVNASAVFPHEIVSLLGTDKDLGNEMWKAQPNWFAQAEGNFRPLVLADFSGSMQSWSFYDGGKTYPPSVSPYVIALALAVYCAERLPGSWKNTFMEFSDTANLITFQGDTLSEKLRTARGCGYVGSTNLEAAYRKILEFGAHFKLTQEQMPTHLLIVSDMEFDKAVSGKVHIENIKELFRRSGYDAPTIVFWNLNGRQGNNQAKKNEQDVILVSGFSPAVIRNVLSMKHVTPLEYMLECVMIDRYNFCEKV